MINYHLNIGDVVASPHSVSYSCLGLGSCIGLFIQDRVAGISAGAHVFLPENEIGPAGLPKFYNVASSLDEILKQFKIHGSDLLSLRAKVTGGANVIGMNSNTAEQNVKSVVNHLMARKIFIAALDVGGIYFRSAEFQSNTGQLTVRIPQLSEQKIY